MDNEYTQKVLDAVERATRAVRSAESRFDSEGRYVQRMANNTTINIYNMSKAVEIVAAVKRTTDDLYSSYESIIRSLDMECRPYLEHGISAEAIKKVAELMKNINEESSSLSSNTSGTFNGSSLGDLRTEYYMASLEARTIEKFWANKYAMTPEAVEEEKRKEAALAEKRKRLAAQAKIEAERKKKEAEEKKRKAELKAAEEKKIEEANAAAKLHMDNCEAECNQRVSEFQNDLKIFIQKTQKRYQDEINQKIEELEKTAEELKAKVLQLSFFKRAEKKAIKEEIKKIEARILKFQDPSVISTEIDSMNEKSKVAVEQYQQQIEEYLSKRFTDYKTTSDKNKKKQLMYLENAEVAKMPVPAPIKPEDVF